MRSNPVLSRAKRAPEWTACITTSVFGIIVSATDLRSGDTGMTESLRNADHMRFARSENMASSVKYQAISNRARLGVFARNSRLGIALKTHILEC